MDRKISKLTGKARWFIELPKHDKETTQKGRGNYNNNEVKEPRATFMVPRSHDGRLLKELSKTEHTLSEALGDRVKLCEMAGRKLSDILVKTKLRFFTHDESWAAAS